MASSLFLSTLPYLAKYRTRPKENLPLRYDTGTGISQSVQFNSVSSIHTHTHTYPTQTAEKRRKRKEKKRERERTGVCFHFCFCFRFCLCFSYLLLLPLSEQIGQVPTNTRRNTELYNSPADERTNRWTDR